LGIWTPFAGAYPQTLGCPPKRVKANFHHIPPSIFGDCSLAM
jgi:hypothetical protein